MTHARTDNEWQVFGPPGVGKTTWLVDQIQNAAASYGSHMVMVASFTRAAAIEIANRADMKKSDKIGTLHAICYRALGRPKVAEGATDDWNQWCRDNRLPSYRLTKSGIDAKDPHARRYGSADNGDALMMESQRYRALMLPEAAWRPHARAFHRQWTNWKRDAGVVDFSDMIETAYDELDEAPGSPMVGFYDEAQDFTKLQLALVRKWGAKMSRFVIVGDDDQCAPPGECVTTANRGSVPIESIVEGFDHLVSLDKDGGLLHRKGYEFQRAVRNFSGDLVVMTTESSRARVTPDHRVIAQWNQNARTAFCVYIMRRGPWFRIGKTKLLRRDKSSASTFGPSIRARQENADAVWILKIFPTEVEALVYEAETAARWGVPTTMWRADGKMKVSSASLAAMFDRLASIIEPRAHDLLQSRGLMPEFPYWSRGDHRKFGPKVHATVRACNLFGAWHEVPIDESNRHPSWRTVTVTREQYTGAVYSLNVDKHHTYVQGGQIVHNCLYGWLGATPDAFLNRSIPDERKRFLRQSYRVPRAVHKYATQWVSKLSRRQDKRYEPRDCDGAVLRRDALTHAEPGALLADMRGHLADGKSVMVLASCGYMLKSLAGEMRIDGLPFHNPYAPTRGDWNMLRSGGDRTSPADRVLAFLTFRREGRMWTNDEWWTWTQTLDSGRVMNRGWKAELERAAVRDPDGSVSMDTVNACLTRDAVSAVVREDLDWLIASMLPSRARIHQFAARVASRHGQAALSERPRVIVGTIHSVKGGEADVVYVFPDLSDAGTAQWSKARTQRDAVIRQYYVAFTRARETLVLCGASSGKRMVEF